MNPIEYLVCRSDMDEDELKKYKKELNINGSKELLESIIKDNPKNKWICFFRTRKEIYEYYNPIRKLFPDHRPIIITYNISESEKLLAEIGENEKVLIFCIDKLLEGIHLPNADGVLLFRNVQSLVVFQQIIGRVS